VALALGHGAHIQMLAFKPSAADQLEDLDPSPPYSQQSLIRSRVLAMPRELEEHQRKMNTARAYLKHPRARNQLDHLVGTIDYILPRKVRAT
jgi:hypothetical protein